MYFENNGYQEINYKIVHGNKSVRAKGTLKPRKHFLFKVKKGKSGKWTIITNTSDGSNMKVIMKARQFN